MATDARFEKITKIENHPMADNLEIAIVSNFPCVVRKGEFKEGEWCFYIRDDSRLLGWDEWQERINRDREAEKTGDFVTQDEFTCTWQWQDNLLKYLGSGGRVKSIKLRGKVSMGILLKIKDVIPLNLAFNNNDYICNSVSVYNNFLGIKIYIQYSFVVLSITRIILVMLKIIKYLIKILSICLNSEVLKIYLITK